ncbi:hypothetical protein cyc_04339 [Cyclospora cayetanensis]|uniref:Uncharacterized protein n=1 Tax=Cyclospora cayetanensis TaxID=88456 RepID=A0A1D3CRI1_9EIME|nr:hypothetical protein cyc_04339 [Cyclospora cayetanensis]
MNPVDEPPTADGDECNALKATGLKAQVKGLAEKLAAAIANPPPPSDDCLVREVPDPDAQQLPLLMEQLKNMMKQEIEKLQQDFQLQAQLQVRENNRFKALLADTKAETDAIHAQMLLTQRQIEKLEEEIGTG